VLVVAFAVVSAIVVSVLLLSRGSDASAADGRRVAGRGAPVRVDHGAARLDRARVVRSLTRARRSSGLPVLADSACLDGAARRAVAEFGRGRVPSSAPDSCGSTAWGWVAGADRTGSQMAASVVARPAARGVRSPFAGTQWHRLGVAVGRRVISGVRSGYVLVWVVGR
jgi:hypothetical protein